MSALIPSQVDAFIEKTSPLWSFLLQRGEGPFDHKHTTNVSLKYWVGVQEPMVIWWLCHLLTHSGEGADKPLIESMLRDTVEPLPENAEAILCQWRTLSAFKEHPSFKGVKHLHAMVFGTFDGVPLRLHRHVPEGIALAFPPGAGSYAIERTYECSEGQIEVHQTLHWSVHGVVRFL